MQDEFSSIHKQLLEEFSLDDAFPLGAPLFMDTPKPGSPFASKNYESFDEVGSHPFQLISVIMFNNAP